MLRPQVLLSEGLVFPESPRWRDGELWLSDMHAHRVVKVDLEGRIEVRAELDDKPSGIGWLPDGTPIVVSMRKRTIVRLDPSGSLYADLSTLPGLRHVNDMAVDDDGRIYVGCRSHPGSGDVSVDVVAHLTPDGTLQSVLTGAWRPNGIVITPDGKTVIVAQTGASNLIAYDVDDDGSLRNGRVFADLDGRAPDGICLDAEGAVWVGCIFAGEYLRVHEGGRVSDRVELDDGDWAMACLLGGPTRNQLFLVNARETMDNALACSDFEADKRSTSRGYVQVVDVDVPGAGWPR